MEEPTKTEPVWPDSVEIGTAGKGIGKLKVYFNARDEGDAVARVAVAVRVLAWAKVEYEQAEKGPTDYLDAQGVA